ncbi:MAG: DUF4434 domain-containing protein [Bacteroidota bacterium]
MLPITGTFLDEISHDIPSANWGPEEWRQDFDAMRAIGIDTVILIRAGYRDKATFHSETLNQHRPMRPVYLDLVDLFLTEAERCGMSFYFGLYDSGTYWLNGQFQQEIDLNKAFTEEVIARYGHRKAFQGWYASHELHGYDEAQMQVYLELSEHLRALKPLPIMMSPYVKGRMQFEDPITPQEHERQWDHILSQLSGKIDIVAFQDGQVAFEELPTFMEINHRLARKYGLTSWSNVETFERGMPINFLPIAWPNLRYKLEVAQQVGVENLITFDFSHFLSPHSMYRSAHNLNQRYQEWMEEKT